MTAQDWAPRLGLLRSIKELAKSGAKLDASIVTTYSFNGLFYEEVLLRAFERAGSRLNIVLVDAGQLSESMGDALRRPSRAGLAYLLAPVPHVGAFHPKIVALLSEGRPILAIGSHNATDAGFSHNEEVAAFWHGSNPVQPGLLGGAVHYALKWLEHSGSVPANLLADVGRRFRSLLPEVPAAASAETSLIASSADAPLWPQLRRMVSGPVRRVMVVGPYFDASMDFLNAIDREMGPREIIVGVQPATAVLPRPDLAPDSTRFVDTSCMRAFWREADEVGFAHGKALAIETEAGLVVTLGSANPTGAAWLPQARWNAEANVCLTGAAAVAALAALGLDRLASAPSLLPTQLAELADRSRAARSQERAASEASGPPLIPGEAVAEGIFLKGFKPPEEGPFALVEADGTSRPATVSARDGGTLVAWGGQRPGGGVRELRCGRVTAAYLLVNDAQALRAATLPRDGARILDHLGSLESGAGLTDLLDLLDRHVLGPADLAADAARHPGGAPQDGSPEGAEVPFGPRGVSLPPGAEPGLKRPRVSDGLIADIIAALIRALSAPAAAPATDGDAPDLDEGDAGGGPSSDQLAHNLEGNADAPAVDWPRLVTACRKRLTVLLKRLEARLDDDPAPGRALGRLLVVLLLLQRLRVHPPQVTGALNGRVRPRSLVGADQLAVGFGVAVCALYGPGKLAVKLESAPDTRAAEERRLVDNLLLWLAREIGADWSPALRERADAAYLQTRADLGLVAMSAAAYETLEPWALNRDPWLAIWDDAATASDDWAESQLAYGVMLQRSRGQPRPKAARRAAVGDIVFWDGERDLPWVVASVSGENMSLKEPAGGQATERRVRQGYVTLLELPVRHVVGGEVRVR